jgi:outer membrane protein assembly factor BamB
VGGVVSRLSIAGDVQWSTAVIAIDGTRPDPSGPVALADLESDGTLELLTGWEDGTMRVFDASEGTPEWVFRTQGEIEAPPVAVDVDGDGVEEVVVASHDRSLYCLDHRVASPK